MDATVIFKTHFLDPKKIKSTVSPEIGQLL